MTGSLRQKQDAIGAMRHRVVIWTYTTSRNAAGEETRTWAEQVTVWAEIDYRMQGDEVTEADKLTARRNAWVRIRYRTDITEKMRVVFDSRGWDIRAIVPDLHRDYMILELEDFADDAWDASIVS